MLTAALLALVTLDLKKPKEVWLGGQREVLLGALPYKTAVLGFYQFIPRALPGEAPDELRVGHVTNQVYLDTFEGKECTVVQTDSRRVQHLGDLPAMNPLNLSERLEIFSDIRKGRRCWVDDKGRILKQEAFENHPDGNFESEAIVNSDDTVSLTVRRNDFEKKSVFYPDGGVAVFQSEYVPMVKDGKVVMREKTYCVLDARGGMKKYTARVGGRFTGSILFVKYEGFVLDVMQGGKTTKAFVSDENEVLKVEYPDKTAAMVELVPLPWDIEERDKKKREAASKARLSQVTVRGGG